MKLLMLGSGTSTGVPRIGEDWGNCDPDEPRNRRSRVSVIVENNAGTRLLVDTSPDLRNQLLANRIDRIDAVFWTHDHADHCHGIDDLRVLRFGRSNPISGFASAHYVRQLRMRFGYVFAGQHGYPSIVDLQSLDNARMYGGIGFSSVEMKHGPTISTGYRFECEGKSIVYATDFSEITDRMVDRFMGVDLLISDCLRREPHPSHATLDMALELGRRTRAKRIVLTHLDKTMDYATIEAETPDHVTVGYDGLEIAA